MDEISAGVQNGKADDVKKLVQQEIDNGAPAQRVLEEGLLAGMGIVGERFKSNEIFVPEVLIAARAMKAGVGLLRPLLIQEENQTKGVVVLGTVKGDLHDIGKNLVGMMLEGRGFDVVDLGTDVPAEDFIKAAREYGAGIIACSALLTTTMNEMRDIISAAEQASIRDTVKIMVGGAPLTHSFCDEIGADAYAPDAASAADAALELSGC
jgi:corrinoid protein of di/trimethylamine methyltransferase